VQFGEKRKKGRYHPCPYGTGGHNLFKKKSGGAPVSDLRGKGTEGQLLGGPTEHVLLQTLSKQGKRKSVSHGGRSSSRGSKNKPLIKPVAEELSSRMAR